MNANQLLTYDDCATVFRAHNLPSSTRTVKRMLDKHRSLCPRRDEGYHIKRVRAGDLSKLVALLVDAGKANGKSAKTIANQKPQP